MSSPPDGVLATVGIVGAGAIGGAYCSTDARRARPAPVGGSAVGALVALLGLAP